jgi:hypothetical protein
MTSVGYDPIIRDIPNFPNYQISENGEVYNKNTGNQLNPSLCTEGYLRFGLRKPTCKMFFVHKLLAMIFIENPDNLKYVDHIDRNKLNNNISNLRWISSLNNNRNRSIAKNNTTGTKGITEQKLDDVEIPYYRVRMMVNGKRKTVSFNQKDDNAYNKALKCKLIMEINNGLEFAPMLHFPKK